MARPRKRKRVCYLPELDRFGPIAEGLPQEDFVRMTVEEYESIRLMDLEKLSQQESADFMGVSRTTLQGMYEEARSKLAESLINGKVLKIEGGDYKLCSEFEDRDQDGDCFCGRNRRGRGNGNGRRKREMDAL